MIGAGLKKLGLTPIPKIPSSILIPPPPPAFFNSDGHYAKVQIRIVCAPKIVFISLPINKNMCFGAQKNRLNETVLLCTHNICYGWEIRK